MAHWAKRLQVVGRSDIGLARQVNQDAFRTHVPAGAEDGDALFVVADGVGGNLPHGEIASRTAVDTLVDAYYEQGDHGTARERIDAAIQQAQAAVRQQAAALGVKAIGTTLAGIVVTAAGAVIVFNVGDSRVYRIRAGMIDFVTRDQINAEPEAAPDNQLPRKRTTKITAYIGQSAPLVPLIHDDLDIQPGDIIVVCSDGLWSKITHNELREALRGYHLDAAADRLMMLVRERGAPDNLTFVTVKIDDPVVAAVPINTTPVGRALPLLIVLGVILIAGGALLASGALNPSTADIPSITPLPLASDTASPTPTPPEVGTIFTAAETLRLYPQANPRDGTPATHIEPGILVEVAANQVLRDGTIWTQLVYQQNGARHTGWTVLPPGKYGVSLSPTPTSPATNG